jgi:hypothetical protein
LSRTPANSAGPAAHYEGIPETSKKYRADSHGSARLTDHGAAQLPHRGMRTRRI